MILLRINIKGKTLPMETEQWFESYHLSINNRGFIYKINSIDTWHGDQEFDVTCEIKTTFIYVL